MFYKTCLALAIGIVALSLIGSLANASSLTLRQQNYVDSRAQTRVRNVYILPNPYYSRGVYTGGGSSSGSSGSGSSRSSYDGYRGGGPGSGK
ncbi:MAG: hypothetical protein AAFQ63_07505 [Cyanobacteria bacterium J06621_11]